ncbi:MAG TPA: hypothetical protein VK506_05045 [Conexibacter sp.]|nr:hypothetical protein [Conexibacter sp.]
MLRSFAQDLVDARVAWFAAVERRRRERSPWFKRRFESKEEEREAYLEALRSWGLATDGEGPARADWSATRDPYGHWPRSERVAHAFRWCDCEQSRVDRMITVPISWDDPTLTPELRASLELGYAYAWTDNPAYPKECTCPSGWQRAIDTAGLAPSTGRNRTTRSELSRHGRNRQMVTAGVADARPVPWSPVASGIEQLRRTGA